MLRNLGVSAGWWRMLQKHDIGMVATLYVARLPVNATFGDYLHPNSNGIYKVSFNQSYCPSI